jgi:hypothetical protein
MLKNQKRITILITIIFQFIFINSKNYWECDTNYKVVCAQTQTCCKVISTDPSKNAIITSFECFEGKNTICCGSKGVCGKNEFCNPLLSKCQKLKISNEVQEKEVDKKNYVMLYQPIHEILKIKKLSKKKIESSFNSETINFLFNNIEKLIKEIPEILDEFKNLDLYYINIPEFLDGLMSGLSIFEPAYRNSSCAWRTRFLIDDSIEFINLLQNLKYDEHFFDKLHLAVDMFKNLYKDYLKQRKSCIETCHKIDCIMNKILRRFKDKEFPTKLIGHTIFYYHELKKKVKDGCDFMKHHDFYQAGFQYGDALRLFAFWDFESKKDCSQIN